MSENQELETKINLIFEDVFRLFTFIYFVWVWHQIKQFLSKQDQANLVEGFLKTGPKGTKKPLLIFKHYFEI